MAVSSVIPDIYTSYQDRQQGQITPGLANIQGMIGSNKAGIPGYIYSFSGATAKQDAKTSLIEGVLYQSVIDALNGGASEVRACRIGDSVQAFITLDNTDSADALTITEKLYYSSKGNSIYASVTRAELYGTVTLTLTIEDRNASPYTEYEYEVSGAEAAVTGLLATAVNDGGYFTATTVLGTKSLKTSGATAMASGADGTVLTNANFTTGFDRLKTQSDVAWVRPVGGTTTAIWTLALTHCQDMFDDYEVECWALLECPAFTTTYDEGTAGYIIDVTNYVTACVLMTAALADKNAVIFAGSVKALDVDGVETYRNVVNFCSGRIANLEVQQSFINKIIPGISSLYPVFTPGQMTQLINARINFVRFKTGRGFIMGHCLTGAAAGSDYSRANDLRTVYYAGKQAREAMQPFIGEANDSDGVGLVNLEAAGSGPLDTMLDNNQIDDFNIIASNVAGTQRRQVRVDMGIKPVGAIEILDHQITLSEDI